MILERHYGKIINGQLQFSERNKIRFDKAIQSLESCDFELTIRKVQRHATNSQYAYYRKCIIRTCLQTETFGGWSEDEIAKYFEELFLSETKLKTLNNKTWEHRITHSIANLSTTEMSVFIEKVIAWLALNNSSIGNPEDYHY